MLKQEPSNIPNIASHLDYSFPDMSAIVDNDEIVYFKGMEFPVEVLSAPRLSELDIVKRPKGYSLNKFISGSVTATLGELEVTGYADAYSNLCREKAVSEAVERVALKLFTIKAKDKYKDQDKYKNKEKTFETSNGWAAHLTPQEAIEQAILELIERDVAITNWEDGGPFFEIPETLWPSEIIEWKSLRDETIEFSDLKIYLSQNQNGCCVSALLFNTTNNFVAGHATKKTLQDSILSAVNECLRAAHSALRFEYFAEVMQLHNHEINQIHAQPGAHSLAYAYSVAIPENVFLVKISEQQIKQLWNTHRKAVDGLDYDNFDIKLFKIANRYVARIKSKYLKEIYWGSINKKAKNHHPHFVG